ncbi:MAG: uroporphyrinogen decarboxylase family protein [Armatimonadota bacterium]
MTPRENLLRLLRRQGYDSVPCHFSLCPSLVETYQARTGGAVPYEEYYGFPFAWVSGPRPAHRETVDWTRYYPDGLADGVTFDNWGVAHEPGSAEAKHMTRMRHPMEHFDSTEQILAYPFPDYAHASEEHIAGEVQAVHNRGLAAISGPGSYGWEVAWYIRSMPQLMVDMMTGDEKATVLLDIMTEIFSRQAAACARGGVDILFGGDDIGMQSQLMMAPELWREWLKPRLATVFQAAKAVKPDILIYYHSCGYVEPLIEDLIEVGVDILQPIQPESMDFATLHAQYDERVTFWGTLGTQTTMPFGTPQQVRDVVLRNLEIAGPHGGLFVAPTHLLEPEVPWENIEAYVAACREFGGND